MKVALILSILAVHSIATSEVCVTPWIAAQHEAERPTCWFGWWKPIDQMFRGQRREAARLLRSFNQHTLERDADAYTRGVATCACQCESCGACISAEVPCARFWELGCYPHCLFDLVNCVTNSVKNYDDGL
jgi:hypothetical protein